MKKLASIFTGLYLLGLLTGCASKDKADYLNALQTFNADNAFVSVWSSDDFEREQALTAEETKMFFDIMHSLAEDDLTENKQLAGITPEYGFHITVDDKDYYINQADAPHGQFEMAYQGKQWWIKSNEIKALYEVVSINLRIDKKQQT